MRLEWIRKYVKIVIDELAPVTNLDEKWFYTTNHCRKIKYLPRVPYEGDDADFIESAVASIPREL